MDVICPPSNLTKQPCFCDRLPAARDMVRDAEAAGVKLYLPTDVMVSSSLDAAQDLKVGPGLVYV